MRFERYDLVWLGEIYLQHSQEKRMKSNFERLQWIGEKASVLLIHHDTEEDEMAAAVGRWRYRYSSQTNLYVDFSGEKTIWKMLIILEMG